jgi:hypothetical protein
MAAFTKVEGTEGVYLLPTLTGAGGDTFKRGGMEYAIASLPEIKQLVLRSVAQKAYARAWGILGAIRTAAYSFGDVTDWVDLSLKTGRIDAYLILTDTKEGEKGALSIEYGRDEYEVHRADGSSYKVGAMTGKGILHRAFGVSVGSLQGTGGGDIPA